MTYRLFCFVKFFEEEAWADDFMKGRLYCNTLQYFKDLEQNGNGRGDPYEGAVALIQPKHAVIKISFNDEKMKDFTIDQKDIVGPVVVQSYDNLSHNVYCLYAIYVEGGDDEFSDENLTPDKFAKRVDLVKGKFKLHDDCFGMGKHAVLIHTVQPFMEALMAYEVKSNMKFRRGIVKYYDENTYNGDFKEHEAIFHKQKKYSHQNEYRIAFRSAGNVAFTVDIGSMDKFACKLTADQVRNMSMELTSGD